MSLGRVDEGRRARVRASVQAVIPDENDVRQWRRDLSLVASLFLAAALGWVAHAVWIR